MVMRIFRSAGMAAVLLATMVMAPGATAAGAGVGNVPQGPQKDAAYARSVKRVSNVFATTQRTSCSRPEVPFAVSDGPNDGYSGESACGTAANTDENTGAALPYPTQLSSNPGYPATSPMLVKDHSESDLRVDPTNANHVMGSSKWFVSPEGYNHLLGFYESFDGGNTWTVQGHIPGYEGWTDNTDPVGAFDSFGNYYEFILAYQFFYNSDGSHNFSIGAPREPNPVQPAEVVAMAVHPRAATSASQWMTIDTNPASPHFNRVYAMWVDFHNRVPLPFVSFADARPDGTHTDWSEPQALPLGSMQPQGDTYLLPHVDPSGAVYTTLTNFN